MASSKKVKKVYICPTCKGNGYVKVACIYEKEDMVHQCWDCESQGELYDYGDEDFSGLMNSLESTDHKNIIASLVIDDECRDLNNCGQLLSQFMNGIERRQNTLLSQIKSAQESNNDELLFELLRKKQEQSVNR